MGRRKRGLGAPDKKHASLARTFAMNAENTLVRLKKPQTCKVHYDHVHSAVNDIAKAWSHGFGSATKVYKGALTPRTVSADVAKLIYRVDEEVTRASERFRRECVKDETAALAGRRRSR